MQPPPVTASSSSPPLQPNLAPTIKQSPPSAPDQLSSYKSSQDSQLEFWDIVLGAIFKLPLIKQCLFFIWKTGLKCLQPKKPISNQKILFFNSQISIPKWFGNDMQEKCLYSWQEHFLNELDCVVENTTRPRHIFSTLSHFKFIQKIEDHPEINKKVEEGFENAIFKLLKKIQIDHFGLLDLKIGGYGSLNDSPTFSLFLRAFVSCMEKNKDHLPILGLGLLTPLDSPDEIKSFIQGLKHFQDLVDLRLYLDFKTLKIALESFQRLSCPSLQKCTIYYFDFRKIEDLEWDHLQKMFLNHKKLKSFECYNISPPNAEWLQSRKLSISPTTGRLEGFAFNLPRT